MTGKTHQVIGVLAAIITVVEVSSPGYQAATLAAAVILAHFFALLPDIDTSTSDIYRILPFGRMVSPIIDPALAHRNLTHSLLGLGIIGWILWVLLHSMPVYWGIAADPVWYAAMAAYLSHIVADMVTVEGVPLLLPYPRMIGFPPFPFQGIRIVTGKWFENLIVFPLANLALLSVIIYYWPVLQTMLFT